MSLAVLFDLDGTLLDSLADLAAAGNHVLRSHGFADHPVDAYRHFVGNGIEILIRRILPIEQRDNDELATRILAEFRARYARAWNVRSHLYDGAMELLTELRRRELPMAVLSNKPEDFTLLCVEHYLAEIPFVAVCGVTDQRPRKPDPAGALEIAGRTGISPDCWVYLGDTATDMQTARGAGMFPVGALWGFRDADELRQAGAERIIGQPMALIDVIDHRS